MPAPANDRLASWDPRRRAALERIRARFKAEGAKATLSDELVAERRQAAAAEDGLSPDDPNFGLLLPPSASAGPAISDRS